MRTVFRLSVLLAGFLSFSSFAFAQNSKPSPTPLPQDNQIRSDVVNVRVPIIITDKKTKQPVTGLTLADFQILEDGIKQDILSFRDEKDNDPIYVAVLMDTSPSTAGKLSFEQQAAKNFIYTVTRLRKDKVAFMTFDDNLEFIQDFTDKLDLLDRAVDKVKKIGNQTALYDAVYTICDEKLRGVPTNKRVIVLITDGDDTYSRADLEDAIDIAQRTDTIVFAISTKGGFAGSTVPGIEAGNVKDKVDKALDKLCGLTGGRVFYTGDMIELERAFTNISKQLRSQYVLAYEPKNKNYDGKDRKIEIKLANPQKNWEVQYKKGYKANREQ